MLKIIKNPIGQEIEIDINKCIEYCSVCDEDVEIDCQFDTLQHCPNCGNSIIPCNLCDLDTCNCGKCNTERKRKYNNLIELWSYGNYDEESDLDRGKSFKIEESDLSKILFFYFDNMYIKDFLNEYTWDWTESILEIAREKGMNIYD